MKQFLKWILLFFSWLTFSPLILPLGRKWKIGNKYVRVFMILLSPLFLVLYLFLFIIVLGLLHEDSRYEYFQDRDRIERITGVRLPEFIVVEYNKGERSFPGDYEDSFTFLFRNLPPDEMFNDIDKMIESGNTSWQRKGDEYIFNHFWGNGIAAPNGENDNEDRTFNIVIHRGEKQGVIRHGMW